MLSPKSKTAIIVLNYKKYKLTCSNVDNLIELDGDYYIIIVDNNSMNESMDFIRDKYSKTEGVYIVASKENRGYSAGNNIGIHEAIKINPSVKYIAIMNPDVIINDREIFNSMIDGAFNNKDIAVVAPRMIEECYKNLDRSGWMISNIWERIFDRTFLHKFFIKGHDIKINGNYHYVDAIHGSFFIVRRNVFEKIGFFDENIFLYGEEIVLAKKIKNIGLIECIDYNFSYIHDHDYSRETITDMVRQGKQTYKSMKYIIEKYYEAKWYHRFLYFIVQGFLYYIYFPVLFRLKRVVKRFKV